MVVTTISKKRIDTVSLPEKVKGQYWLYENNERLISVEGINNEWILKSNRQVKIVDSHNQTLKNTLISPLSIYVLVKSDGEKIFVFTEPVSEDRQIFTKYIVKKDVNITIGRSEQNDICFANKVVSAKHATLSFRNGKWFLQDTDSTNGTFVNEERISKVELSIGDTIFIMGLKIIIGKNIIAVNNPDGNVKISDKLGVFVNQSVTQAEDEDEYEITEQEYFYRSPRFKREVETATFKIDSPPSSPISEEMPWILVMGSSLAMGMMSMVTLGSAIAAENTTSIVMGASMLVGTVLLPMITKKYEKMKKFKKEI